MRCNSRGFLIFSLEKFPPLCAESDTQAATECVMTVLMNWCGAWAEMFPYPPLADLGRVKTLLELHDPQLCAHLLACGAGPDVFAWPLLRTAMSEVLPKQDVWNLLACQSLHVVGTI